MHGLAALLFHVKMGKVEACDRLQGEGQRLVDFCPAVLAPKLPAHLAQGSQHLSPIESLTFTVFAEVGHGIRTSEVGTLTLPESGGF